MTDRGAIRVPLPLRPDELVDLLLQQLPQHAQPNLHRQRQQPLPRSPDQLPQRLLHTPRKGALIAGRLHDRYGLTHGGSSLDLCRIAHHAPTQSGRVGGTAATSKFHEPRDNLRAAAFAIRDRLHAAQNEFYRDGNDRALGALLDPDIRWPVPGSCPIAGTYPGLDEVVAYFADRRDRATGAFRMHRRDVLTEEGPRLALTDGTASISGTQHASPTAASSRRGCSRGH